MTDYRKKSFSPLRDPQLMNVHRWSHFGKHLVASPKILTNSVPEKCPKRNFHTGTDYLPEYLQLGEGEAGRKNPKGHQQKSEWINCERVPQGNIIGSQNK